MHRLPLSFLLAVVILAFSARPAIAAPVNPEPAESPRFPKVEIAAKFAPPGESNVRSSFKVADGVAVIGTEETGDIYRTDDAGQTWTKIIDTDELWEISDVRNFIRAQDGAILAGLRRSENNKISIIRSEDGFATHDTVVLSDTLPRQNTTSLYDLGGGVVLCGVGYEASGKIFKSADAGLTWTQTAEFEDARDMMDFFEVGDKVYAMCSGVSKLFVSDDAGDSWTTAAQIWEKGFLGQAATIQHDGRSFLLLAATDQRTKKEPRHVVLISDDAGQTWFEWIQLAVDTSGGASNLAVINNNTLIVGTGNHSVQGYVYTLQFH